MSLTTDPAHPDLARGTDDKPVEQAKAYLIALPADIAKGNIRPYFDSYTHTTCGKVTTMASAIAATYASDPWFYGGAYCFHCRMHRHHLEYVWPDGASLDPHEWTPEVSALVMKAIADRSLAREAEGKPSAKQKYWKAVEPPPKPVALLPTAVTLVLDRVKFTYADGSETWQDAPRK